MSVGTGLLLEPPSTAVTSSSKRVRIGSQRLIGLVGLCSFDCIVAGAFISPPLWSAPGTTSTAAEVARYSQQNATRITVSAFVYSVAMGLFLCFAAGLWRWWHDREGGSKVLSSLFGLSALAAFILIEASFVPAALLGYRSEPANIAGLLADLTFGLLALSALPTALLLGSYAAMVLRWGGLPRWTAYVAAAAAAAHLFLTASFLSHGPFLSLESGVIVWVPATFFIWILTVSAVFCRGRV